MKPLKALRSLWLGLLATVSPQRFADAGVKVDVDLTPVGEAIRYRKRAQEAEVKLDAATDAFRQIECLTDDLKNCDEFREIHTTAQLGYRATQA